MTKNQYRLNNLEITQLLQELDQVLTYNNKEVTIYILGGANIALTIDHFRTTTDIDVEVKKGEEYIAEAANIIANAHPEVDLQEDWINDVFTNYWGGITAWNWLDNKDADKPTVYFSGNALRVELASKEMMLALKTMSARPEKDMDDIKKLMDITGINTLPKLKKNLERFSGKRIFQQQNDPNAPKLNERLRDVILEVYGNSPKPQSRIQTITNIIKNGFSFKRESKLLNNLRKPKQSELDIPFKSEQTQPIVVTQPEQPEIKPKVIYTGQSSEFNMGDIDPGGYLASGKWAKKQIAQYAADVEQFGIENVPFPTDLNPDEYLSSLSPTQITDIKQTEQIDGHER